VERGPMPMPPAQRRIATDERPLRGLARGAHLTAEPRVERRRNWLMANRSTYARNHPPTHDPGRLCEPVDPGCALGSREV
jgi:hypothetical protein